MTAVPSLPTFRSSLTCEDPMAALRWLERAFGFEVSLLVTLPDGRLAHAEMTFGGGSIMLGSAWNDRTKSPGAVGGANTQHVHVHLEEDVDTHCERARAAGATILQEPEDQFFGDRTYRAVDPEGHMWTFGQTVRGVSFAEMEASSGLKLRTTL